MNNEELVKRVNEIFEEKRIDSINAFSEKCGVPRMNLSRSLKEGRPFKRSELEKIATGVGITYERLTKKDTAEQEKTLLALIESGHHPKKAKIIASELLPLAIGSTEQMFFNCYMGETLVMTREYEEAETYFSLSFQHAKKTDNTMFAKKSANNIVWLHYNSKDYKAMCETVKEFEEYFRGDDEFLSKYHMYLGLCAYNSSKMDEAISHYETAIKHTEICGDKKQQGRLIYNLADIHYKLGNINKANELLSESLPMMESDNIRYKLTVYKLLIQISVKLGANDFALSIADKALSEIEEFNVIIPEIESKILLLKSVLLDTDEFALRVFYKTGLNDKDVIPSAQKYLANYYFKGGEYQKSAMYFSRIQDYMFSIKAVLDL